jgi:hypothetical protein
MEHKWQPISLFFQPHKKRKNVPYKGSHYTPKATSPNLDPAKKSQGTIHYGDNMRDAGFYLLQ